MRTIKFRAWDKLRNSMVSVGTNIFDMFDGLEVDYWKENMVLMQFTGLHDKNGKEIYKGDIVKYKTKNFEYIDVIEFRGSCFCIGNEDTGFTVDDYLVKEIEVIGNIYENPELLTNHK